MMRMIHMLAGAALLVAPAVGGFAPASAAPSAARNAGYPTARPAGSVSAAWSANKAAGENGIGKEASGEGENGIAKEAAAEGENGIARQAASEGENGIAKQAAGEGGIARQA
jgi:hypothetical protein